VSGSRRRSRGPVGAQGVGQHEGVEAVVLVAGRAVPAAQVLDLVGADHHHGQLGLQQGVDHRPVGSFDRDLADAVPAQEGDQVTQAGRGVLHEGAGYFPAPVIDDAYGMIVAGPVDAGNHLVQRSFEQGVTGG
jgi:hypothetical protein